MTLYASQIQPPNSEYDFEDLCAVVYGKQYNDPSPKRNGRRGQAQGGVDIFVSAAGGTIAVQCKRYDTGKLLLRHIEEEVARADGSGERIDRFIVATTASSDARLLSSVREMSQTRTANGQFPVEIDFWEEIQAYIRRHPELEARFDPSAPGGAIHKLSQNQLALPDRVAEKVVDQLSAHLAQLTAHLSRPDVSAEELRRVQTDLKRLVESELNAVVALMNKGRYRDAETSLARIESAYDSLDRHNRAFWHLWRGNCRIHLHTVKSGAEDLCHAYEIYPDDALIVAGAVNGLRLQGDCEGALRLGTAAVQKYPLSAPIWGNIGLARVELDGNVSASDFPPEILNTAEILTVLCSAAGKNKHVQLAWQYAKELLNHPNLNVTRRSSALAAAVAYGGPNLPGGELEAVSDGDKLDALNQVVQKLEPREESLWQVQSGVLLPRDAYKLIYAYERLNRPADVLAMCDEARSHPTVYNILLGSKLRALHHLERYADLVREATESIDQIPPDAFVAAAEGAVAAGNIELIRLVGARAVAYSPEIDDVTIQAWIAHALLNLDRREESVAQALSIGNGPSTHPRALLITARTLLAAGEIESGTERLVKAGDKIDATMSLDLQLELADCYHFTQQYSLAAAIYERVYNNGARELGPQLLECYVEAGMRVKARELITTLPHDWIANDKARKAAISLASRASDWDLLRGICSDQLVQRPDHAGTWLLVIHCERYGGAMARLFEIIKAIPESLNGTVPQIAHVAALQVQYGATLLGLRRLYRMVRANLQSDEAASAYIRTILIRDEIAELRQTPEEVGPATACVLQSSDGRRIEICIEPDDLGDMPNERNYFRADHPIAVALIGKRVGDSVNLPGPFATGREMVIEQIHPIYRHMFIRLQNLAETAAGGLPLLETRRVLDTDGKVDLSEIHQMVRDHAGSSQAEFVFDTYGKGPITLGLLATALDTSTLELVTSWPSNGPALRVRSGTAIEMLTSQVLLKKGLGSVVVDLATLGDLVALGCERALRAADTVFISSTGVQILNRLRDKVSGPPPKARAAVIDGEVTFFPYPEDYHARLLQFYDRIAEVVHEYCEVCPAYGTGDISTNFTSLDGQLGDDEYEALLLAVEKEAVLLSIDRHLRELAEACLECKTLWPQAFIGYAASRNDIANNDFRKASQLLFHSHRGFTMIDADDVMFMLVQGTEQLQACVQKIALEFSGKSTGFDSSLRVIEELLPRICLYARTFSVLLELVEALYEPLWRHPHCPRNFMDQVSAHLVMFVESQRSRALRPLRGSAKQEEDSSLRTMYELLLNAIKAASDRAQKQYVLRTLPLKVVFGSKRPTIIFNDATFVNAEKVC